MDVIEKLTSAFIKFPGIGPRQARRFVSHLLATDARYIGELQMLLGQLQKLSRRCSECGRHFLPRRDETGCRVCADDTRDTSLLMVVEKDVDVDHIDRVGIYRGTFFVLGGTVPLMEKQPEEKVRIRDLVHTVEKRMKSGTLKEIIFALSTNVEGEETVLLLQRYLAPLTSQHPLTLTTLGRGLSTGAEIEYADKETLRNALQNRSVGT